MLLLLVLLLLLFLLLALLLALLLGLALLFPFIMLPLPLLQDQPHLGWYIISLLIGT